MSKVIIIDYQLGNLFSVNQALLNIGLDVSISSDFNDINAADAIVLPGVGAFKDAMENLEQHKLIGPIKSFIQSGKPFLGICLGLQLLFTESEEFGASKGLDIIPGNVKRFLNQDNAGAPVRVPQIAWNQLLPPPKGWKDTPLDQLKEGEHMYFVHSYYVEPADENVSLSFTKYHDLKYTSSILKDNIFACQFHPEKSADKGLLIYKQWATRNNLI